MQSRSVWELSPRKAIALQKELREKIKLKPLTAVPKTIAGVDVSLNRFEKYLYAGIIVLSFPDLVEIEHALVKTTVEFPYIPGLLSFREIPGLLECFKKLRTTPDVLIVDGQGIAHPRRLGIATHLGLVLDIPTIGCAKSRLYGVYEPPIAVGDAAPLYDGKTNEQIGVVLQSKARTNPLFISPGYKITISDSVRLVEGTLRGYRLPEPTRRAHNLVNDFRPGLLDH